jgi:hypothetical protein
MSRILLLTALIAALAAPAHAGGTGYGRYRIGGGDARLDALGGAVQFGLPEPVAVTREELVVDVPVRVRPVGVSGRVERVEFRDLALNGIPFEVDPYEASFDLSESDPVTLPAPVRLRVKFLAVAPGLVREGLMPSDTLRLTGTATVSGVYRKWIFSLRRAVEVPIEVAGPNPIADYHPARLFFEDSEGLRTLTEEFRKDARQLELNLQKLRIPSWPF